MNENIDLTKILKNCPRGWKFYSSVHGEVKFETIKFQRLKYRYDPYVPIYHQQIFEEDKLPIKFTVQDVEYCVSSAGEHIKGKGECTFFPSKDQRDWNKFQIPAKRGDIMMFTDKSAVFIIDTKKNNYTDTIAYVGNNTSFKIGEHIFRSYIPASEDMKDKLFAAMNEAGYEWDGKTLKKKPQFKPFEKVLVRDNETEKWRCTFYSYFEPYSTYSHVTSDSAYAMCIPFEGNEHLVGTTNNP